MSSPARVLAVLALFTPERPVWHTDEINEALGYARATGYRYVRELVETGFLRKVAAGRYALGPRIIELDYQLRRSDPVLLAAAPVMDALMARSGLDVVLSSLFGGMQIVDIHRVSPDGLLQLQYGRGRPRPLFHGGAPKVILAHLPRAALQRIHQACADEIARAGLGADWPAFRAHLQAIRQRGCYLSLGEVDEGIGAMAVSVLDPEGDVVAALALVGKAECLKARDPQQLKSWLDEAAAEIRAGIGRRMQPTAHIKV